MQAEAGFKGITLEEARAQGVAAIPLGRMAFPEEIANAVLFLASDKASYLTGVTIAMDGAQNPVVL
jgi:NAD(P)-dependent dehydrogenase (short-subunit alcohol dehydrogenase family)